MITWTDENIEKLKDGIEKGSTARQIANDIGCSRCAVIGRVYRTKKLTLPHLPNAKKKKRTSHKKPKPAETKKKTTFRFGSRRKKPDPEYTEDAGPGMSACHDQPPYIKCQYIYGPPTGPDRLYCGQEALPEKSWCQMHNDLCTTKTTPWGMG